MLPAKVSHAVVSGGRSPRRAGWGVDRAVLCRGNLLRPGPLLDDSGQRELTIIQDLACRGERAETEKGERREEGGRLFSPKGRITLSTQHDATQTYLIGRLPA